MRHGTIWSALAIMLIVMSTPSGAAEAPALQRLLESLTDHEEHWQGAIYEVGRLTGRPSVLLKQPMHQNHIVVLVYDLEQQGQGWVEIELLQGDLVDKWKSLETVWHSNTEKWKLVELSPVEGRLSATGIFSGKIPVRGTHGTRVKVKYSTANAKDKSSLTLESETIGMFFH